MDTQKRKRFEVVMFWVIMAAAISTVNAQSPFFITGTPITVEQGAGIVIGDFNGDRIPDLLTKHERFVTLSIGDGRGNFARQKPPQSLVCEPTYLTLVDVNKDGLMDLGMTAKQNNQELVYIYIGTISGIFELAPGSPLKISEEARFYKPSLRFADLNEDGNADFIASNERRNTLHVYTGDGAGKFTSSGTITLDPDKWTYTFALTDLDGDQHVDLITTSGAIVSGPAPGKLFFRKGTGKGTFSAPSQEVWEVPADPRLALVTDLNGDQYADLVLVHGRDKVLTTLISDGRGKFSTVKQSPMKMTAFTVVATDVNGDKHLDLVAATVDGRTPPHPSRLEVLIGDGAGSFDAAENAAVPTPPASYRLVSQDLNNDGKSDLVISSFGAKKLTVLYGR
jgi:hypothetical protein